MYNIINVWNTVSHKGIWTELLCVSKKIKQQKTAPGVYRRVGFVQTMPVMMQNQGMNGNPEWVYNEIHWVVVLQMSDSKSKEG